jgi:hypothetical protein
MDATTPYQNFQAKRLVPVVAKGLSISTFLKSCLIDQCVSSGGSLRDSKEAGPRVGRESNLCQPILQWRGLKLLVILLCSLHGYWASCQEIPSVSQPLRMAVFGTFTDIKPTFQVVGDLAVWGFTAGGYIQTPHVLGVELRGSITKWGGPLHQEALALGPRAALHFGRFTPYTAVLVGVTNSWEYHNPQKPVPTERASPALTALGGVDFHMSHHISLRLGEVSYSRIHRSDVDLNSFGASAGIVYRVPW